MTTIFWNTGASGSWTIASNWDPEVVPGSGDDAVLGVTGFAITQNYTVSLVATIAVDSITISDPGAVLSIEAPGAATVSGNVANAADIELQDGGSLDVLGDLSNVSETNSTAVVNIDTQSGGSTLTVAGTLTNSSTINIGNGSLASPTLVKVGTLDNTGTINLTGNSSSGSSDRAVLDVAAAPSTWTGTVTLAGQALLEFGSGKIDSIAQGAEIYLGTGNGYVADQGSTSSNSALTGLTSVAGDFELQNGAKVGISGDLTVGGSLEVDTQTDYGDNYSGGSSLAIAGELTNGGTLSIGGAFFGVGGLTSTSTVNAATLDNTGTINLTGNSAIGDTQQAVLDIAADAPSTWTGTINLSGQALLEFGGGQIGTIAKGAEIYLATPDGYIADKGSTSSNSALTGLTAVAGDFELQYGATVGIAGDLAVTGSLEVDTQTDYGDNYSGDSSLAITGALTNSGTLAIGGAFFGVGGLTSTSTITAGALDNTGTINLTGNSAVGDTKQAVLDITGAAPSTWTGTISFSGQSLLEFATGGITSIAQGAEIYLASQDGYIAEAGSTSSNSALTGLTSNAGDFELQYGATVGADGDLANTGTINIDTQTDYGDDPSGGSTLTIGGELTNSSTINVGNSLLTAATLVSAASLDNTAAGTINLTGGSKYATTLDILASAPATWTGTVSLSGEASLEFGGGSIETIAQGGDISLSTGTGYIEDASATGANSALTGLASNAGGFYVDFGANVTLDGDLANTGTLGVDEHVVDGFDNSGGSILKIKGTLTNSATVDVGNYALSGASLLTVGALDNTSAGTIDITGTGSNAATLDVAAAAPSTWNGTLDLSGEASLEFGGGSIHVIAQGADISLSTGTGYIEDAGATGANSALTGLTSNAGGLYIDFGASVSLGGDLANTGTLGVDEHVVDGFDNSGGSTLKIKGTLTNSATLDIGNYALSGPTLVKAGALDNTAAGTINITGAGGNAATFDVAAAAPAIWNGTLSISGEASLVFGGGSIHGIAQGANIYLSASNGYIADSSAATSNSALAGLTGNVGGLYIDFGASVSLDGGLANTGTLGVDEHVIDGFDNSGGSTLKIAGGLTNSGSVYIGNYALSATATFSAASFTNQSGGSVTITGSGSAQALVDVTGALDNAGTLTVDNNVSADVGKLDNTNTLDVYGSGGLPTSLAVLGTAANSDAMTIGAYAELGVVGAFTDSGALNLGGTLDLASGLDVTGTGSLAMQGGTVLPFANKLLTVDANGVVSGDGTIGLAVANSGKVTASGGLLDLQAPVTGDGSLAIATGSELELGGATAESVGFDDDVGTLKLDHPSSFTGSVTGLVQGDTIDLAGVRATSAVVDGSTLTVTAGAQTYSYQVSGPGLSSNTFALEDDQQGGTDLVLGPPGPTISGPTTQTAFLGWPTVFGPLTIADPNAGSGLLTVTVTSGTGVLTGAAANAGTLTGSGGNKLTLTGDLADINTMLAGVTYSGATAGATDDVQVAVTDASHATAAQTVAVTTGTVPFTEVTENVPDQIVLIDSSPTAIGQLSVSDPWAQSNGQTITLGVTAPEVTFEADGFGGNVIGQDSKNVEMVGIPNVINEYLSDQLEGDFAATQSLTARETIIVRTLINLPKSLSPTTGAPALTNAQIVAQFEANAGVLVKAFGSVLRALEVAGVAPKPNVLTLDGLSYEFNAVGEFVLIESNDLGNPFQIQVRLQPYDGSTSASAITQVAVAVGSDRVTFGIDRAATVWVDGNPSDLSPDNPIDLPNGTVTQLGPNTFNVSYNTGEVVTVVDYGSYLGLTVNPGGDITPGSFVGLMGPDAGQSDDFLESNGTVLQQPLTTAQLAEFADSWRVTDANSLLDYAPGQSTATFTDLNAPNPLISLSDLPTNIVAMAAQAVSSTGITDAGAVAAMEYDYIATGGNPSILAADASFFQGATTTPAQTTESGPTPGVLGVFAPVSSVAESQSGPTAVAFDVYLTAAEATDTEVDYTVIAPDADDFAAADFGGTLPTGSVTIVAGQTTGTIAIDVPQGALGALPSKDVALQISSLGGVPIFAPTSVEAVSAAQATAPSGTAGGGSTVAIPELEYLGDVGTFTRSGDDYTLDLGDVQLGEALPALLFGVANGASAPGDQLTGSFTWPTVAGYEVNVDGDDTSGASLKTPIAAGSSDQALTVTTIQDKFGAQSETVTFTPVDTNASGYSKQLTPITLTIADTLEVPGMIYSQATGDVHIITYNGLHYDFQAVGEFTLAKSNIADDSFDIQLRLQPYTTSSSVTLIQQVAASLGSDRVTFGVTGPERSATVLVDGNATSLSVADPTLTLAGGTITEISPSMWTVAWNTGESMTVNESSAFDGFPYFNVSDSVPYASEGEISGLQGENEGTQNDFQLPDGTVLQQPLTSAELYGEYANAWRVGATKSLMDYGPGQSYATFDITNFPSDPVTLADLPASLVAKAAALVAAAGITDPVTAQDAELDYLATGDPTFISTAADVNQQVTNTVAPTITPSTPPTAAIGIDANATNVTENASGATAVTFTAYLTAAESTATTIDYAVVDSNSSDLGATAFGGVLPSGTVTFAAGATSAQITIDVPEGALGATPDANLQVQVSSPGDALPIFAPTAQTEIVSDKPEAGALADPVLAYLGNVGTFSFDKTTETYTLNLGGVTQGAAVVAAEFAVVNAATGPSDNLSGTFTPPVGQGFTVTGDNLPSPLAAGEVYQGLYTSVNTADLGANQMSLTFDPEDVNDSGYSQALTPLKLHIVDSVQPPAQPTINTPTTIIFPNAHVGATDSQFVSVTNSAAAGAQDLDVTLTASGAATASGTVSGLAPGATDASDLKVGIDTATAGAQSGSVTENFVSDAGGGVAASVDPEDPYIDVFGDVYRLAAGEAAPNDLTVPVGASGAQALTITNSDADDGYSENLIATVVGTTGAVTASGTTGDIKPQADGSIAVKFSTATAGPVGSVTLDLESDGTGIDGLGETNLGDVTVPVAVTAGNVPAAAEFEERSGGGTFTQNGTAYTLALGTINTPDTVSLGVLNSATAPADALSGRFTIAADDEFVNSGFGAFSDVAAGDADTSPTVTLGNSELGSFSETITMTPTASDGAANPPPGPETLTITGTVATTPPTVTISAVEDDNVIDYAQASAPGGVPLSGTATGLAAGATFQVSVTDGDFDKSYTATVDSAGTGWTAAIPEADAITLPNGTATLTAQAKDAYGNLSPVATDQVRVAMCFCPGTHILTDAGEVAVETLAIGDRVTTLHGGTRAIKWIGRRSYDGRFVAGQPLMLPVCIKRGAIEENVPARDLWVSPGHGIGLDGALVPAWLLANGVSIVQAETVESVSYIHIELADHEVIFAEGCPAETFFGDAFRGQFQNASEFHVLYPDHQPGRGVPCLPRIEDGFQLQAIQRRLAARAGAEIATEQSGPLRGYVDIAGPRVVAGWVQSETHPEVPVCLDILVDGRRAMRALANRYRADLREAGLGSGRHSFEVPLPDGVSGRVEVRRSADQARLALTEAALALAA